MIEQKTYTTIDKKAAVVVDTCITIYVENGLTGQNEKISLSIAQGCEIAAKILEVTK